MTANEILNNFESVLEGDDERFVSVTGPNMIDQRRWVTRWEKVVQFVEDDTFWQLGWDVGSTENQESEYNAHVVQVYPKTVTVVQYTTNKE